MFGSRPEPPLLRDRVDAGRQLLAALAHHGNRATAADNNNNDTIVLALPRGGVPVAYEIASALNVPLDLMVVRKLGMPGAPECAMGAIAMDDVVYLDQRFANGVFESEVRRIIKEESAELNRRNKHYRGDKPYPNLTGKNVVIVDDGIATGATMRAAALAVRKMYTPARIVVAAPVGAPSSTRALRDVADEIVCLHQPPRFSSVGQWWVKKREGRRGAAGGYGAFPQTEDDEVLHLLAKAEHFGASSGKEE
ncbi:hypothetical protein HDU86_001117 [Geranomyces michiganensis]|nr:hypothetical protein HDU86_001117 [Geranomyces michiganensis]